MRFAVTTAAVLAVSDGMVSAPWAVADPTPYWNTFHDRTTDFVATQDPAAFTVNADRTRRQPEGDRSIIDRSRCRGGTVADRR